MNNSLRVILASVIVSGLFLLNINFTKAQTNITKSVQSGDNITLTGNFTGPICAGQSGPLEISKIWARITGVPVAIDYATVLALLKIGEPGPIGIQQRSNTGSVATITMDLQARNANFSYSPEQVVLFQVANARALGSGTANIQLGMTSVSGCSSVETKAVVQATPAPENNLNSNEEDNQENQEVVEEEIMEELKTEISLEQNQDKESNSQSEKEPKNVVARLVKSIREFFKNLFRSGKIN